MGLSRLLLRIFRFGLAKLNIRLLLSYINGKSRLSEENLKSLMVFKFTRSTSDKHFYLIVRKLEY